ncbi:GDP-mannose 4,6-dehydratase [Streptomyces sp. MB09-02B]|uniref:GDP-mannose 4,6-dehydratase n=1 Tax=Streptomyces sp. MB09-02B TaxID=3028667 RepID=UPI0029B1EBB0|nr:GDP-mannose 4,6-dehydratase [Streptomyces sp. MB09-02B]MDX3640012.1 GDP-mannose 4,6-dehydratase [Streptomyces sp. MB09-02B]
MKRALITGVTGQDGSYLAEHLLRCGYEVWGLLRGQPSPHRSRISRIADDLKFVEGDLLDQSSLVAAVDRAQPDEVYNLAAISYVPMSWQQADLTGEVTGLGVLRMLEAIRMVSGIGRSGTTSMAGQIRFYQASSSEMFGKVREVPQNEDTALHPRSPYGVAKTYGHFITRNYRESFGLFAVSGILFNHESPRRGREFVTRKISRAAARISKGLQSELRLGNLDAVRDWGFAGDYVKAMHLMLQQGNPGDYVVGTGRTHSVRDAVRIAFETVGLDWSRHVVCDSRLVRPAEVDLLCADPKRARAQLGWEPTVDFDELVRMMVEADLERAEREQRDVARAPTEPEGDW